ncbi:MAG: pantetheine-phosphate adenylyltransferase [Clostridia bacterium]
MKTAIFAGSFDPVTLGHLDIIKRACLIFDKVIVAVMNNCEKRYLFDLNERYEMVSLLTNEIPNATAIKYDNLLSKLAYENDAVIIKAVRSAFDMQNEFEMYLINKELSNTDTVVLFSDKKYLHISSSFVREMIKYNHSLKNAVDEKVIKYINKNLGEKNV